jgi:hypothetical protein
MRVNIHFLLYLAHIFLELEIFQKNVVENIETHFVFNNLFFENRAVCGIISKNMVEPNRPQMTIK